MALFRALESARPPGIRLFEDPSATRFLQPRLRAVAQAARFGPAQSLIVSYIDRRWPGPRPSGVVRTRAIDDFVDAAISDGAKQLLLLGAGYDTRATRLPAATSCTAFEVDHPATQARKRSALGAPAEHVRYIPVDFEHDSLTAALADCGFDRHARTCVVWEGVFSYLTREAIDVTLAALVELCTPGSQLLLTYVDERALEDPSSMGPAWFAAVEAVGEPFQTGLHPDRARAFFAERDLILREDESTTEAARRLGVDDADAIPRLYRLATLEVGPNGGAPPRDGDQRAELG